MTIVQKRGRVELSQQARRLNPRFPVKRGWVMGRYVQFQTLSTLSAMQGSHDVLRKQFTSIATPGLPLACQVVMDSLVVVWGSQSTPRPPKSHMHAFIRPKQPSMTPMGAMGGRNTDESLWNLSSLAHYIRNTRNHYIRRTQEHIKKVHQNDLIAIIRYTHFTLELLHNHFDGYLPFCVNICVNCHVN